MSTNTLETETTQTHEWKPGDPLREDGPTLEEYVARGYKAENYPPTGYAPRTVSIAPPPAGKSKTRFFKKINVGMPLMILGARVQFTVLGGNLGVIAISDDLPLCDELDELSKANGGNGRAGVVAIDEATFEELKKKQPLIPLPPNSKPRLQVFNPQTIPRKLKPSPANVAPVAAVKPKVEQTISSGVGPDGVGEAGGAVSPALPASIPLATAPKSFKMPVVKKTNSKSLSGGVPEPEEAEA